MVWREHSSCCTLAQTRWKHYSCPQPIFVGGLSLKGARVSTNDFTDRGSSRVCDLSQNKSLRELKITVGSLIAESMNRTPTTTSGSLRAAVSTIKSPVFSKVVFVYQETDFYHFLRFPDALPDIMSPGEAVWYRMQFDAFREMHKARDFRLVLQASRVSDRSVRELKQAVAAETARGGLPPELLVIYPGAEPAVSSIQILSPRGSHVLTPNTFNSRSDASGFRRTVNGGVGVG